MNVDRALVKKIAAGGLGVVALVLLWRRMRAGQVDEKPSTGDEVKGGPGAESSYLTLLNSQLTPAQAAAFRDALPDRAKQYAPLFIAAGEKNGVSPLVLAGLMFTETRYGQVCKDVTCMGFTKHDFGLMQINDIHKEFFARKVNGRPAYEDPAASIMYAGAVLRDSIRKMRGSPNKSGRYPVYNSWRPGKYGCPASAVEKSAIAKGGATVPDKRPVDGMLALRAGIAGYNAGPGYPPIALGCDRDPDVVTHNGAYVATALGEANRLLSAMKNTGVA